jgi:hypothetical protein
MEEKTHKEQRVHDELISYNKHQQMPPFSWWKNLTRLLRNLTHSSVQAGHYRYKFSLDSKFLKYTKIKESILSSAKFR